MSRDLKGSLEQGELRKMPYGSSSCLLKLVTVLQEWNSRVHLKGCSALKILEAVGWEKGTLESSIGEKPADDLESGLSVGLVVPFCVLGESVFLLVGRRSRSTRITNVDRL